MTSWPELGRVVGVQDGRATQDQGRECVCYRRMYEAVAYTDGGGMIFVAREA